jgi:DNA-binding beta-propeller fold protein YncE
VASESGSRYRPRVPATDRVTRTIDLGVGPEGVAVDPAAHTVYATSDLPDSVYVIQPCR